MALPINFSEKAKQPPNPAAGGYPYSIKADDLDANFRWCDLQAQEEPHPSGLRLVIDTEGSGKSVQRTIRLEGDANYGANGSLTILDCNGVNLGLIEWENGLIRTYQDIVVNVGGCDETLAPPAP